MADTIPVTCPECDKSMQVPAKLVGKKIRCKGCEATVLVKEPKAAKPAKPAPASPPPPPARPNDDDDENADPYGAQKDDLDIPRCPFCAKELDPPDTLICLNCGYDLVQRRRHESRRVHAHTQADYLKHLAPGIACVFVVAGFITLIVLAIMYMGDLFTEIGLQDDNENPITKKKEYIAPPGACTLPFTVLSLFIIYKAGWFAIRRLFINWRPPERKKEKK
jgi:hypothetical protein